MARAIIYEDGVKKVQCPSCGKKYPAAEAEHDNQECKNCQPRQ
ncbi:MAG: hypothetical protein PHT36_01615 [Patescibacteria group bacterium]|nr:hypothetical protein [Patescibacteria group bacterium]